MKSTLQWLIKFPYNIHPLAFLDYNEDKIVGEIKQLGWQMPDDTDSNSTNCLLNAFANDVHIKNLNSIPMYGRLQTW